MHNRYEITYYRSSLERQNSYLTLHDLMQDTYKEFHPQIKLGEGSYGQVRLFACHDEKLAVKSLKDERSTNLSKHEVADRKREIISEFKFLRRAYPDPECYYLEHFEDPLIDKSSNGKKKVPQQFNYTYRMTMPFINGKNLAAFAVANITRPKDMAKLILRVAEELQRFHDAGVIHGDFGDRNILVTGTLENYTVHGIDFGLAADVNGYAESGFLKDTSSDDTSADMAYEKFSHKKLKAHPAQDVFSFGKVINKMLRKMGADWEQGFRREYPTINHFLKRAVIKDQPEKRPGLAQFIKTLESQIDWTKSLADNMQDLVKTLTSSSASAARGLMEAKAGQYTLAKLAELLARMMENREYQLAGRLLHLKKKIPLDDLQPTDVAILKLFTFIAAHERSEHASKHSFFTDSTDEATLTAAQYLGNTIASEDAVAHSGKQFARHLRYIQQHEDLNDIYHELLEHDLLPKGSGILSGITRLLGY